MNQNVNGQDKMFEGYGGIEDITRYIAAKYGSGWTETRTSAVFGIGGFTQSRLEKDANNCTLASITRVMKYYADRGYDNIPSNIEDIYEAVRRIGVKHGYDPKKTGLLRDLFIYTPWEIDNMVRETWREFGYSDGGGNNSYFEKLKTIKKNIDNSTPLLLNLTFGDYPGHTVSVTGYKVFSKKGEGDLNFIQIYDGWSETVRYIDWKGLGMIPASVTTILPPLAAIDSE